MNRGWRNVSPLLCIYLNASKHLLENGLPSTPWHGLSKYRKKFAAAPSAEQQKQQQQRYRRWRSSKFADKQSVIALYDLLLPRRLEFFTGFPPTSFSLVRRMGSCLGISKKAASSWTDQVKGCFEWKPSWKYPTDFLAHSVSFATISSSVNSAAEAAVAAADASRKRRRMGCCCFILRSSRSVCLCRQKWRRNFKRIQYYGTRLSYQWACVCAWVEVYRCFVCSNEIVDIHSSASCYFFRARYKSDAVAHKWNNIPYSKINCHTSLLRRIISACPSFMSWRVIKGMTLPKAHRKHFSVLLTYQVNYKKVCTPWLESDNGHSLSNIQQSQSYNRCYHGEARSYVARKFRVNSHN